MKNIKEIATVVAKNKKVSYETAHEIIEDTFNEISKSLLNEEEVRIKNFATFKFGKIAGKTTKHPTTKQEIVIPDRKTVRLGLSTKIKKGLN